MSTTLFSHNFIKYNSETYLLNMTFYLIIIIVIHADKKEMY